MPLDSNEGSPSSRRKQRNWPRHRQALREGGRVCLRNSLIVAVEASSARTIALRDHVAQSQRRSRFAIARWIAGKNAPHVRVLEICNSPATLPPPR